MNGISHVWRLGVAVALGLLPLESTSAGLPSAVAPDSSGALEEVVVTAERREERVLNGPENRARGFGQSGQNELYEHRSLIMKYFDV